MLCVALPILLANARPTNAQTVQDVDFPGALYTEVHGINSSGDVVGEYYDEESTHGFLLSGETYTAIDATGVDGTVIGTRAYGINDSGQIVGAYDTDDYHTHGFILNGGTFTTVDAGEDNTILYGINDSGVSVGIYFHMPETNHAKHGVIRAAGGSITLFDYASDEEETAATDIADDGTIVGWGTDGFGVYGYKRIGGVISSIGSRCPSAEIGVSEYGINTDGTITGGLSSAGFICTEDKFAVFNVPDSAYTVVNGINDDDLVVGTYCDEEWTCHGFISTPAPKLTLFLDVNNNFERSCLSSGGKVQTRHHPAR
jgi:probable HAF family extracellular repeat protein